MSKRQILYLVLSFIVTIVLLMIVAVTVLLLQKPQVEVVWAKGTEAPKAVQTVKKGKWEGKEKQAIGMVRATEVPSPPAADEKRGRKKKGDEPETTTIGDLVKDAFLAKTFKLEHLGKGTWEARYLKGSYYFVSFHRRDGLIDRGPTWLVDVKAKKILPKNVMARASFNAENVSNRKYFEHERQVIGAIANHSFESGVKLGGIMLIHFSNLSEEATTKAAKNGKKDGEVAASRIVGWTVVHDYGDLYRAYFQWTEQGEPTYADFEFNYAKKELRSRNLQAANFMNLGKDFEDMQKAEIMPSTFNAEATSERDLWTGQSRDNCRKKDYKKQCDAMASVLRDKSQIEAVEWLLAVQAEDKAAFEACKKDRRCKWKSNTDDNNIYHIEYLYNLDVKVGEQKVSWDVDLKKKKIIPRNAIAEMAFLAVRPRPRKAAKPAVAPAPTPEPTP